MTGCHFTREEAFKSQKGLRFRFLESQGLKNGLKKIGIVHHLNSAEVMVVE